MNAAFNGRPILMHERDTRRDLEKCIQQQEPCFRLFLEIVGLLDKVIGLYRPVATLEELESLSQTFPSFEDLVLSSDAESIGTWFLGKILSMFVR